MKYLLVALSLALTYAAAAQTKTPPKKKPTTTHRPADKKLQTSQNTNGIDPGVGEPVTTPPPPQVYQFVEQMPQPPYDLTEYLSKTINYPDTAKKSGIQGRVVVQFVVNENGKISDVKALRGIGGGCDEEAVRVIKAMPPWKPGKQNGKMVKVYYTQPISFLLQD
jgi:protein TonB